MDEKKKFEDSATSFSDLASKYISSEPNETKSASTSPSGDILSRDDVVEKVNLRNDAVKNDNIIAPTKSRKPNDALNSKKGSSKTSEKASGFARTPLYKNEKLNQNESDMMDISSGFPVNTDKADLNKDKISTNKTLKKFARRNKDKKQKKSFLSKIDVTRFTKDTYIFFGIVTALSIAMSVYAVLCVNDLFGLTKSKDSISVVLTEEDIESSSKAIDTLRENKLIKCPIFCKIFASLRTTYDKDGERDSSSIGPPYTPSTFELNGKMGIEGMLKTMQGGAAEKETVTVTFAEGYTVPQILQKLVDSEVYSPSEVEAFEKALQNETSTYALSSGLKVSEEVPYKFEGYLFPETYTFYKNEKPKSVINKFLDVFEKKITKEDREKAEQLGYTMEQIIIIASIIEKEAGTKAQMPIVSAVIHNRLPLKSEYPMLGCDSTANYIRDSIGPNLTVNSPHNAAYYSGYYDTYTIRGLPAGPICSPGLNAIKAALNPDPKSKNIYYFCHDLKGVMYTAETQPQHRINVANHVGK